MVFSEEEVDRLARRLGMERQQFIDTYLERTEGLGKNPWQTRTTPCPFLSPDSKVRNVTFRLV